MREALDIARIYLLLICAALGAGCFFVFAAQGVRQLAIARRLLAGL